MKGTRAKGNRLELERQRQFEAAGALVLRAPMKMVRIGPGKDDWIMTSADFFGVADLLASWEALENKTWINYGSRLHVVVSVTTLTNVAARRKKMGARAEELIRYGWTCEVHARADRKPWRVWRAAAFRLPEVLGVALADSTVGWTEVPDYLPKPQPKRKATVA